MSERHRNPEHRCAVAGGERFVTQTRGSLLWADVTISAASCCLHRAAGPLDTTCNRRAGRWQYESNVGPRRVSRVYGDLAAAGFACSFRRVAAGGTATTQLGSPDANDKLDTRKTACASCYFGPASTTLHSFPYKVMSTMTITVVPAVTIYPDGTHLTGVFTPPWRFHNWTNATAEPVVYFDHTADMVWTVNGMEMFYPTTYVQYIKFQKAVRSSLRKTGREHLGCQSQLTTYTLDVPTDVAPASLFYPLLYNRLLNIVPSPLLEYLEEVGQSHNDTRFQNLKSCGALLSKTMPRRRVLARQANATTVTRNRGLGSGGNITSMTTSQLVSETGEPATILCLGASQTVVSASTQSSASIQLITSEYEPPPITKTPASTLTLAVFRETTSVTTTISAVSVLTPTPSSTYLVLSMVEDHSDTADTTTAHNSTNSVLLIKDRLIGKRAI
ncbi:hypothetical protein HII31_01148 [Pseudocercospora fuligena]|uniref:Uncharacterized protein n=1 Tax=Pseudocercospora fuligena TaxID=685502 RepID=A0A8H6VM08_9PEZI|nr:hypothetical protein HII31_01148 [Pseudocercospora fuligena]